MVEKLYGTICPKGRFTPRSWFARYPYNRGQDIGVGPHNALSKTGTLGRGKVT